MAKSLETVLPGFKPSELQEAAIERIRYCQDELRTYGMYARSAMELEFMIGDDKGMLVPGIINLPHVHDYISEQARLPFIDKVEYEGDIGRGIGNTRLATQYEITVSDQHVALDRRPRDFMPDVIAGVVEQLKKKTIADMLLETTCLTQGHSLEDNSVLRPIFSAYPFVGVNKDSISFNRDTSSLHVNVSLYDKQGRNLFALSRRLLDHCANAMVEIQNEAGLAMLPSDNSVARMGANSSAPGGLGVVMGKAFGGNRHTSVSIRGAVSYPMDEDDAQHIRIENRLPGADADPFVSMAVTMSALVAAVRKNVTLSREEGSDTVKVSVAPTQKENNEVLYARADKPLSHRALVDGFESSARARELLGGRLYNAILAEYRDGHAQTPLLG